VKFANLSEMLLLLQILVKITPPKSRAGRWLGGDLRGYPACRSQQFRADLGNPSTSKASLRVQGTQEPSSFSSEKWDQGTEALIALESSPSLEKLRSQKGKSSGKLQVPERSPGCKHSPPGPGNAVGAGSVGLPRGPCWHRGL